MTAEPEGEGSDPPVLPLPRVRPRLILTEDDLAEVCDDLASVDEIVLDVETIGGLDTHMNTVTWVGLGGSFGVHLIPIGHANGYLLEAEHVEEDVPDMSTVRPYKNNPNRFTKPKTYKVRVPPLFTEPPAQLRPDIVMAAIRPYLFSDRVIIGHNVKYDIKSMAKYFGGELMPGPYRDTMIAQHVVDENLTGYGLKDLITSWLLGKAARKPEVKAAYYPNLGSDILAHSVDQIARYLAKDITFTRWLDRRLMSIIERHDLLDGLDLEMDLFPVLMGMEYHGMYVDVSAAQELQTAMQDDLRNLENEAASIVGMKFALTNNNLKRKYLFDKKSEGGQGLKPTATTPTGMPKVDKGSMERLAETNRLAAVFLEYGELDKLRGSFVDKFSSGEILVDGRVHTEFHQHRTATTRLSSSNPNLQQIPNRTELGKRFRKAFVASPGHSLICVDYDQIELRCIAYISGDPEMVRLFETGEDIHRGAAAGAFDVPFEDVTDEQRSVGKMVNFLIAYGGSAVRLAAQIGRSVDDCEEIIERYYERFSALELMKAKIIDQAVRNGSRQDPARFPPYIEIPPFGRRRRVEGLYSRDRYDVFRAQRQLVNAVIQGFAATVMKLGMIEMDRAITASGSAARLVLTVHDEIVVEAEEREAQDVYDLVTSAMEGVALEGQPILGSRVPLVASGGIGHTWVEAKG